MNIRIETVSFRYTSHHAGQKPVFENLSLNVPSGQVVGVLGREGSGKSTLLQMLDGLVTPEAGRVLLEDADMTLAGAGTTTGRQRWTRARKKIGICFQFPEHQFFGETVRDEFLFGRKERGWEEADVIERAAVLLRETGLDAGAIMPRSPFTLSMGEARRVALAVILLYRPKLLLIDELSAGLDAHGVQTVLDLLSRSRSEGTTIIAVSHDTDFLAEIAGRVIILEGGSIAGDGEVGVILGDAALLSRHGYAPPQTVVVAEELRRLGLSLPRHLYRVGELIAAAPGFRRVEV